MSRVCAVSGKGPLSGNKRSHSMRASRRKWNVNLQKVRVVVDGKPQTIRVSARTLKTLKKQKVRQIKKPFGNDGHCKTGFIYLNTNIFLYSKNNTKEKIWKKYLCNMPLLQASGHLVIQLRHFCHLFIITSGKNNQSILR